MTAAVSGPRPAVVLTLTNNKHGKWPCGRGTDSATRLCDLSYISVGEILASDGCLAGHSPQGRVGGVMTVAGLFLFMQDRVGEILPS